MQYATLDILNRSSSGRVLVGAAFGRFLGLHALDSIHDERLDERAGARDQMGSLAGGVFIV
jgi:hypothetical protein